MLEIMFKDNLKFLLAKTGKNKSDVARAAGVSPQSASDYLKGSIPQTDKMILLADYFGVSPGDLHYGNFDESIYVPRQNGVRLPVLKMDNVDLFINQEYKPDDSWYCTYEVDRNSFIVVQEGDSMACGDESLSIPDGSMIIIEPDATLEPKKVVLAKIVSSGVYTIKRFVQDAGRAYLAANNTMYAPIPVDSDIEIIGVAKYSVNQKDLM